MDVKLVTLYPKAEQGLQVGALLRQGNRFHAAGIPINRIAVAAGKYCNSHQQKLRTGMPNVLCRRRRKHEPCANCGWKTSPHIPLQRMSPDYYLSMGLPPGKLPKIISKPGRPG